MLLPAGFTYAGATLRNISSPQINLRMFHPWKETLPMALSFWRRKNICLFILFAERIMKNYCIYGLKSQKQCLRVIVTQTCSNFTTILWRVHVKQTLFTDLAGTSFKVRHLLTMVICSHLIRAFLLKRTMDKEVLYGTKTGLAWCVCCRHLIRRAAKNGPTGISFFGSVSSIKQDGNCKPTLPN